jgi:ABC-type taurine transport system ATPase subunit
LAETIPVSKRRSLADKLVDLILLSKKDDKMPSSLAKVILGCWQRNGLDTAPSLAALLEASLLLEPEGTLTALNELQLVEIAESIRTQTRSAEA